ncbi:hypothetical protein IQ17_01750 [Bradyrhizobium daqingense]|uniref:Uncharacterized protein n=1 Tax=Bradyrhizobium daqingense TaxID=993502 RepID=A0A562LIJ1_9BRAD|nr:hypothetical protein IQ17_01750 [Bradyrhizobium daqingense]
MQRFRPMKPPTAFSCAPLQDRLPRPKSETAAILISAASAAACLPSNSYMGTTQPLKYNPITAQLNDERGWDARRRRIDRAWRPQPAIAAIAQCLMWSAFPARRARNVRKPVLSSGGRRTDCLLRKVDRCRSISSGRRKVIEIANAGRGGREACRPARHANVHMSQHGEHPTRRARTYCPNCQYIPTGT